MNKKDYPILEFDKTPMAIIEPTEVHKKVQIANHCVICFFNEVIEKVLSENKHRIAYKSIWESGDINIYEIDYNESKIALVQGLVGAPSCAALFEEAIAIGCNKFVVCGGAGVLNKDIAVGKLIVPVTAIRDEGTSYHYLQPGREVAASPKAIKAIENTLKERKIDYIKSKTWTTDGVYRETPEKIELRKSEGALAVEMEAAALFAVGQFRNITIGQILYGGDDVSGEKWDQRGWNGRKSIRENLFHLATEACLRL